MRKTLKTGLGALILSGAMLIPGCGPNDVKDSEPVSKKEERKLSFDELVEKEIRKHDSWIVDHIKRAHTEEDKSGFVVTRAPEAWMKKREELGYISFGAAYHRGWNRMLLPGGNQENAENSLDAIDHELSHYLLDDKGEKGLIFREGYNGPSLESISEHTNKKVAGSDFDELKLRMKKKEEFQYIQGIVGRFSLQLKDVGNFAVEYDGSLKMFENLKNDEESKPYLKESEMKDMERSFSEVKAKVAKIESVIEELGGWVVEREKAFDKGDLSDLTLEGVIRMKKDVAKFGETFFTIRDTYSRAKGLGDEVDTIKGNIETRKIEEDIRKLERDLKEEKEEVLRRSLKRRIEGEKSSLRLHKSAVGNIEFFGALMEGIGGIRGTVGDLNNVIITAQNVYQIDQILGNPDEVFARMVDSLYSLHYGPVKQNFFPLNDNDLEFMGRLEYKGEKLFKKGLEKYRVGREMIEDGIDPKEVKEKLEYATEFSYEGKNYSWPESDYSVGGKLPDDPEMVKSLKRWEEEDRKDEERRKEREKERKERQEKYRKAFEKNPPKVRLVR